MSYLSESNPDSNYHDSAVNNKPARQVFFIAGAGISESVLKKHLKQGKNKKSTVAMVKIFQVKFGHNFHPLAVDNAISTGYASSKWSVLNGAEAMHENAASNYKPIFRTVKAIQQKVKNYDTPIDIIGFSFGSVVAAQAILLLKEQGYNVQLLIAAKSMIKELNPLHDALSKHGVKVLFNPNQDYYEDPVTRSSGNSASEALTNWKDVIKNELAAVKANSKRPKGVEKQHGHSGGAEDITHPSRILKQYLDWLTL